jgi:hypothetical protein
VPKARSFLENLHTCSAFVLSIPELHSLANSFLGPLQQLREILLFMQQLQGLDLGFAVAVASLERT